MSWPLSQDYNEAIQSPATNFADADLKKGEVVTNALGLPIPFSGNFADVYQVRCPDGSRWAVKCFTREAHGLRERYQEISAWLRKAKLPFTVDFSYLEKGIRVAGKWHPVLKMQWVEGLTLNQFVAQYLDKPAMLEALLQLWAKMGKYLRAARVGHCDLQHGNVLLVPGSTPNALALKLIDYDGMWIPPLADMKSGEVGHANYQHPRRLREGTYNLEVDRFPLLLVATALRALKADKSLWAKYDNGDNLLFKESDLADPNRSALFQELASLPDPGLVMLAAQVRAALKGSLESTALLEDVMPEAKAPPSGAGLIKAAPKTAKAFAFDAGPPSTRTTRKPATKKAAGMPVGVLVVALVGIVVLIGGAAGAFVLMRGSGVNKPEAGPSLGQTRPVDSSAHDEVKSTQPDEGQEEPPTKSVPAKLLPDNEAVHRPDLGSKPPTTSVPPKPSPDNETVHRPDLGSKPPTVVKKPEPKPAAPDEAALADADKEIKDVHKAEFAKKKPADVLALAAKLLQEGIDTKDKPAVRFALLREARDLAARIGDFPLALRAIDETANRFDVDAQEMKLKAVEAGARAAGAPLANVRVAEAALPLAEEAEDADDFDLADRYLKIAQAAGRATNIGALISSLHERATEMEALHKAYEPVKAALQTLAGKPDDADANRTLGTYLCLTKGAWSRGLPALAQGSDPKLKALAVADLGSTPDPDAQVELAKNYLAQAETESGAAKTHLRRRACYWYQKAAAHLTGLPRTEAIKKIAEIEKTMPRQHPALVRAYYGTNNDWQDVTDRIRRLFILNKGQKLSVKADAGELGVPNHDNGQGKTLVIVYQVEGQTCLSITPEGATAAIPAAPGVQDTEAVWPAPGQELLILAARYGAEGTWVDATAPVQHLVKGQALSGVKGDGFGLGDPAFGKGKALLVVYRYGNQTRFHAFGQNEPVELGAVAAKP
jgi:hypothetical protein